MLPRKNWTPPITRLTLTCLTSLITVGFSGCAASGTPGVLYRCPALARYGAPEQAVAGAELAKMDPGDPLRVMFDDYGRLRKECIAAAQ